VNKSACHIWLRAESRADEARAPLTPTGAAKLIAAGFQVTVENSQQRAVPFGEYTALGCVPAGKGSWPGAPKDAIILGLKELPLDGGPLAHCHIMFGHAYKEQAAGRVLLKRFAAGGGTLLDLEYLTDDHGKRVAAFGYWAGFAGAAVSVLSYGAQNKGGITGSVGAFASEADMIEAARQALDGAPARALIIGALGRVGSGAAELCEKVGIATSLWDIAETRHGGPFPEILEHEIFLNCILARPGCPVFVPETALAADRQLRVIGDIACDPDSAYNPIPIYDRATSWAAPVHRVFDDPVLDIMAIDNLPSLLPRESSQDFAGQLLPHLLQLNDSGDPVWDDPVWARARKLFQQAITAF